MNIRGKIYRAFMRLAHKYSWHYAPPVFPENNIQLWCQWCGFRDTFDGEHHKYNPKTGLIELRMDVVAEEIKLRNSKMMTTCGVHDDPNCKKCSELLMTQNDSFTK